MKVVTEEGEVRIGLDRTTALLKTESTHYKFSDLYANISGEFKYIKILYITRKSNQLT